MMKNQPDAPVETSAYSRELFNLMIETVRDYAVFMTDVEGRVVSWNPGVGQVLGFAEDEFTGQMASIIFTPEDLARGAHPAEMETARRAGRAEDKRWHVRRDGSLFWANGVLTALRDRNGDLSGFAKVLRDDTEQKRFEESLQKSEERYRTLFNSIDQGFCIIEMLFDENGRAVDYRFAEINPAFERMTGIPDDEALGEKTARQLIPNLEDKWVDIYGKVALTGESIRFEDDSPAMNRWFDVYCFRFGGAESRRVAVLFNNISDRKRAEEKLRESDARLRLALDISQTATFEIDLPTDAVKTDEKGRAIYGFEKDEPLTFTLVQSRFHPDDAGAMSEKVSAAIAPGNSPDEFEVEQRIIRTNGEVRWIRVRGRVFFDRAAAAPCRASRFLGTFIDITERKQVEDERERLLKQLEIERSRLAYLFTKAPAFVATLRGAEHVFELVNPAYLQLIGHRDVIGKPVRSAVPEVEGQGFFEILDEVFRSGEPFIGKELPITLQREPGADSEQRFIDFVYQPIFEENKTVAGIFAHGIDITEQVRARREAEIANRAKDEFLATLSHELRTPLNAILGWSRIMEDEKLDETVRARAVATVVRNARLQSQLIDDILDVSRIISGKMRLDVRTVELTSVIESALESVMPSAEAKEIRLQSVLDTSGCLVSGDPNRLQQIIWNLLTNAVKFTAKGGRVQIRLEPVNSHVEIIVSDTGTGISPEVLPYIFDRFRQADSATTRQQGGLGLGLAIVRHLVEMHGGTVEAESSGQNEGSTFTVKLPLIALRSVEAEPAETRREQRAPPATDGVDAFECAPELEGLHILVVEDEADSRLLVTTVLEKCGARVTAVGSAAEGLKALKELRPDVLISDIGMPGEDGYSLIEKVRALPASEGGKTPAAALTAYARTEDRLKILRAGFQVHLPKPVEPSELVAAVAENLIGRQRAG